MKSLSIPDKYSDPVQNIITDTLEKSKQAIIFVNTKRGAESQAEKISLKIKSSSNELDEISKLALNSLSSPTRQCKRLAMVLKKGIAFHHAGLTSKQRELIEDNFRKGIVKVICATPTLAMGVDLPAFRVIVRDLKRYGGPWGMQDIPVLEYEQMAGRAGRPGHEDYGEAICLAKTETDFDSIFEKYVRGEAEEIYSKLAVEPVLRTHVLSLIASNFVKDKESLFSFFKKTFYAYQYEDDFKLQQVLMKIIDLLDEWEFIKKSGGGDFVSANELDQESYEITILGKRVSELYLDPLTANFFVTCLRRSTSIATTDFSFLNMVCNALEMRPLLRVKMSEYEDIQGKTLEHNNSLIVLEPSQFDENYDDFLNAYKTSFFMLDWIEEKTEEYLLDTYDVRPGEIHAKLEIADWLIYSCSEIARILKFQQLLSKLNKVRLRLKYGVSEDLLPLLKIKGVGRVRARKLYSNKLKTLNDLKNAEVQSIAQLIGKFIAISIKNQLGQDVDASKIKISNKKKGQISLDSYSK